MICYWTNWSSISSVLLEGICEHHLLQAVLFSLCLSLHLQSLLLRMTNLWCNLSRTLNLTECVYSMLYTFTYGIGYVFDGLIRIQLRSKWGVSAMDLCKDICQLQQALVSASHHKQAPDQWLELEFALPSFVVTVLQDYWAVLKVRYRNTFDVRRLYSSSHRLRSMWAMRLTGCSDT